MFFEVNEILKWTSIGIWAFLIILIFVLAISIDVIYLGLGVFSGLPSLLLASFTNGELWSVITQIALFGVLLLIGYFMVCVFRKRFRKKVPYKGPIEEYIGMESKLIHSSFEILQQGNPIYGQIKIQGKFFRTLSDKGEGFIEKDSLVKIARVEGNTFYIKKVK